MGIFSQSRQRYVPPMGPVVTGGAPSLQTMLADGALDRPSSYYDSDVPQGGLVPSSPDVEHVPATTAELRFRRIQAPLVGRDTPYDHAFIVVTDSATGKQWIHQASPQGPEGDPVLGSVFATNEEYKKGEARGYDAPYKVAGRFSTDADAESLNDRLRTYSARFNRSRTPYQLPPLLFMLPESRRAQFPTQNSNYFGGGAWEDLTGSRPALPDGVNAPGWQDHLRVPLEEGE